MTPASFRAWRVRLFGERGQKASAEALGCGRNQIRIWEEGKTKIPRYIALACQAIANGLPPMGEHERAVEEFMKGSQWTPEQIKRFR